MNETYDEGDKYKRDCQADKDRAQPGNPPGNTLIVPTPAKPKDSDHKDGTANHGGVKALLCGRETVPLFQETRVWA
jgi:hypothetical protein